MAKKKADGGVNKSEFSRQLLSKNPDATAKTAIEEWTKADHPSDADTIKRLGQSFTNLKSTWKKRQGGSTAPKGKPGRKPGIKAALPVPATNGSVGGYDEIELFIDKAIMAAMALHDETLASSLRATRREVIKRSL